jgi:hypothetical protein
MILSSRRSATILLAGTLVLGVSACGKGASTTSAAGSSVVSSPSVSVSMSESGQPSAAAGGAGAASMSPTVDPAACKKVRFAVHAGLGGGAVHRYLWKPYRAGTFASGAAGRKTAIVKGGLAGGFAYHEFKVALADIQSCPSAQAVTTAVRDGLTKATALVAGLKSGTLDPKALAAVNGQVASIESAAKTDGITVQEKDPTAVQLATDNTGA